MKLKEIISGLQEFAPSAYQESYDNSGLLCGHPDMEIKSALLCLDTTEAVLEEAISLGCNLIIAHHPIVFTGLKTITGKNYVERVMLKAIRNDIAIFAAHTNMDNVESGVNSMIAEKLDLRNCTVLQPKHNLLKRLITFCPEDKADSLRDALYRAGAGSIGNYDECSFNSLGIGTFRPSEDANPYSGEIGKRAEEKELKIETIYPAYLESKILSALIKNHPYEEVAYDLISITNAHQQVGSGLIGELEKEMGEMDFLKMLKQRFKAESIRYTGLRGKKLSKVALCGGSGSFLLPRAIAAGADIFISADFKYHQFFDADNQIIIADIGHFESEQFTPDLFYKILTKKFNTFALHLSKINTNPIKYL